MAPSRLDFMRGLRHAQTTTSIFTLFVNFNMEMYRSGRNENDSKDFHYLVISSGRFGFPMKFSENEKTTVFFLRSGFSFRTS